MNYCIKGIPKLFFSDLADKCGYIIPGSSTLPFFFNQRTAIFPLVSFRYSMFHSKSRFYPQSSKVPPLRSNPHFDNRASNCISPTAYIDHSLQDFLLDDITNEELHNISWCFNIDYLGQASFPGTFPAKCVCWDINHRLFTSLVCSFHKALEPKSPARNIIFLINTGSPYTYLSQKAIEALTGNYSDLPDALQVCIQTKKTILAYLSPKNSHFANANVLGMDFLVKIRVFPQLNIEDQSFILQ